MKNVPTLSTTNVPGVPGTETPEDILVVAMRRSTVEKLERLKKMLDCKTLEEAIEMTLDYWSPPFGADPFEGDNEADAHQEKP